MDYAFLPKHIPNNKEYKDNESKIKEYEKAIEKLKENADFRIVEEEFDTNEEASVVAAEIASLKRQLNAMLSKKNIIQQNIKDNKTPSQVDLTKLSHFFPGIELKNLNDVITFHSSINDILKKEMYEQVGDLQIQIETLESKILNLNNILRQLKGPLRASSDVYESVAELRQSIKQLQSQNKNKLEHDRIIQEAKDAEEKRKETEKQVLDVIQNEMNDMQQNLCEAIYGKGSPFCKIEFPKVDSYTFTTEDNKSTGFKYVNLVLHDVALLKLTQLPCIIHDSLLFKNIGDSPIDGILPIYL